MWFIHQTFGGVLGLCIALLSTEIHFNVSPTGRKWCQVSQKWSNSPSSTMSFCMFCFCWHFLFFQDSVFSFVLPSLLPFLALIWQTFYQNLKALLHEVSINLWPWIAITISLLSVTSCFRASCTILTRWVLFLALLRTFSTTSLPWMKTLNSTLRYCIWWVRWVDVLCCGMLLMLHCACVWTFSLFFVSYSSVPSLCKQLNKKLILVAYFSFFSNRFHTLKSTWTKSVTFWMVSAVNHLQQYFDLPVYCKIKKSNVATMWLLHSWFD